MDPVQFDQGEGGWRTLIGSVKEEEIANLILNYIELSHSKVDEYNEGKSGSEVFPISLLYFHAGQSFAVAGTKYYPKAIECFKNSYEEDKECWNAYVEGTIAFLRGSKTEVDRQIKIVNDSKSKNKKGGNVGILNNFSKSLEQGIKDYEKVYSMPQAI